MTITACGRKGDPIPPPSKVPAAPPDLVALQQGPDIVLRFSYPSATEGGLPLTEVEGVSVLTYKRSAPELLAAPPAAEVTGDEVMGDEVMGDEVMGDGVMGDEVTGDEVPSEEALNEDEEDPFAAFLGDAPEAELEGELPPLPRVDRNTFNSLAGLTLEIDGADLGSYVEGSQVVVRLTDEEFRSDPWIHAYAVIVRANGRNSAPSNIAVVNPVVPPAAVTTAEVEGSEDGVRIRWQLLDDQSITGYNVYRRSADEALFGEPFGTTSPDQDWFVDTSAEMGSRLVYAVTALGPREVESAWGNQKEIFYRDIYPPSVPTALVAIPDAEGVRLLWRHQPTGDHRGYMITRSLGDVTETLSETPVTGLEFTDRTTTSGSEYVYHVMAVDEAGNASEASEPVTVIAP